MDDVQYQTAYAALHAAHVAAENVLARFLIALFLTNDAVPRSVLFTVARATASRHELLAHLPDILADLTRADAVQAARLGQAVAVLAQNRRAQHDRPKVMEDKAEAVRSVVAALRAATPDATGRALVIRAGGPCEVWTVVVEGKTFWKLAPVRLAPGAVASPARVSKRDPTWRVQPFTREI